MSTLSSPGRAFRMQSKAGNAIRRPPNSGESSGYSSSGYSSASSYTDTTTDGDGIDSSRQLSSSTSPYAPSPPIRGNEQVQIARLLLAMACFWPLLFLLIPPSSSRSNVALLSTGMVDTMDSHSLSQHIKSMERKTHDKIDKLRSITSSKISAKKEYLRKEMKSLLRRTDVVGYGASKPRVAVVVVVPTPTKTNYKISEEEELLAGALEAVESIFRTTDRNRIFIVTVVMDGRGKVGSFEAKLQDIDDGRTAHRHGNEVHTHDHHHDLRQQKIKEGENDVEAHAHSEKIHTIYNHETLGVSSSRKEAVQFINILSNKHEEAGIKSQDEELILLFLRCDAQIREGGVGERTWLDDVTDALILKTSEEPDQAKNQQKLSPPANAVSFVMDYSSTDTDGNIEIHSSHVGEILSFDNTLQPVHGSASGQDMALSNGESYPTPLTSVTGLRLATYNAFPASDEILTNHLSADLEMSFNLWMCADGVDILGSSLARVVVDPMILSSYEKSELSGPLAARIVSAWMDGHENEAYAKVVFKAVAESSAASWQHKMVAAQGQQQKDHTMSDQRILLDKTQEFTQILVRIASEAKQSTSFPLGLAKKCRSFSSFVQQVHPKMEISQEDGENSSAHADLLHQQPPAVKERLLPSKPLREENMAIISKASPVRLAYEDVSGGHMNHPHRGATDENGVFGYVHDETALHSNPPHFAFKDDNERQRLCKKGDSNYKMLTEKVYVDLTNHEAAERRAEHGLAKKKRAKIFCLVYTIEKYHNKIPAIHETWG